MTTSRCAYRICGAHIERLKAFKLIVRKSCLVLAGSGIRIPTYNPCQSEQPVGFVRLWAGQNRHSFVTTPAGIACPPDIDSHEQIIVTDAPLLCLRLAQAGAVGVILAESPEVLPPMADWLKTKQIVIASYKNQGLTKLGANFDALGLRSTRALVGLDLARTSKESLDALGIAKESLLVEQPKAEPITPQLIASIVEFAQRRLAEGEGLDFLRELGADDPELVSAYGMGYLPADFRSAMPRGVRRSLVSPSFERQARLGNSLVIPAMDRSGMPVNLLSIQGHRTTPLLTRNSGLLGSKVATSNEHVIVVDSLGKLVHRWKSGDRNVLLLRGLEDALLNAERLYASGIRSATVIAHRQGNEIAEALRQAGIEVEREKPQKKSPKKKPATPAVSQTALPVKPKPAPPQPEVPPIPPVETEAKPDDIRPQFPERPAFVSFDPKEERAVFKAGDATYTLEVTLDDRSKLEVRLERGGHVALDSFDLSVEPQRKRFATSAALRTGVPFEIVIEHLLFLLDEARRIRAEQLNPVSTPAAKVSVSDKEKEGAIAFLRKPDLLSAIVDDLEALGWVGEQKTKQLLFLVGLSRKLERPLSVALRAPSGAGKSTGQETISLLTPPEDVLHVSRLTDASLYYHAQDALRHKLIVIDEADVLTPEVAVSLRVLQSRGSLSQVFTQRDQATGKTLTQMADVQGPVAVMTSTTAELDEELLSRCYQVTVDDSPEQTRRILEAQRNLSADPSHNQRRTEIVRRHHSIQRVLEGNSVVIPFASRIEFPATSIQFRREQQRFLSLISASALLHRFQRKQNGGHIVADEEDFRIALELVGDHIAKAADELSDNARDVLSLIVEAGLANFSINDLKSRRPNWTRHKFRVGLNALIKCELLGTAGRTRPRQYSLLPGAEEAIEPAPVRLRPFGDLATSGETPFTNTTPNKATG